MSTEQTGPLAGIRVIEVGQILAGPFTTTMLGYFGAEIIKIETPGTGDPIRGWRTVKNGTSLWWHSHARNKKSVTVNLKTEEGQQIVRDLCQGADVLVENFRPGQMERWNLGPDTIKAVNANLIYTRISGYGQTGPYASRAGFASVCEGFGGFRYVNGIPGERPVRPNLSIGDTLAGIHAALGVCLALIAKLRGNTEGGQIVDVSIFESVFNLLEGVVPEYSGAGQVREPAGTTITGIAPSNTYRCGDGKLIVIGANTEPMFERLMRAMGRDDLAEDPELRSNAGRVAQQQMLDDAIEAWTRTLSMAEALVALEKASVAGGPIYSVEDMFNDPQYQARDLLESVTVDGEKLVIPAIVPKLTETPGATRWTGPTLGQHTDEVLEELLSFDEEKRAALRKNGVI
ncbi:MAG: CaiB/BaiF CoA transferase family protein [Lysobacterales bacterium]